MEQKQISKAVISRLPRYYGIWESCWRTAVERISSGELSAKMKVTASQIRQDLNKFGGFGQQGVRVQRNIPVHGNRQDSGLDRPHGLIIIGAGNLGQLSPITPILNGGVLSSKACLTSIPP